MMQVQHQNQNDQKRNEENSHEWPKFLICVAMFEIIIAVIAATGLGLNVLATSNGVADIKLLNTSAVIGQYYAHVSMETDGYQFTGSFENVTETDNEFYSYKNAYQDNCGKSAPTTSSSSKCGARYAIWQWTRAYTALGTIATIIVFISGVVLLLLSCWASFFNWCCGDKGENKGWCRNLCSCTIELWLWALNLLVFILFAFSWAIILGIKFNNNLKTILAQEANRALNQRSDIETYDFTFDTIKIGRSLWPLAVASLLSFMVAMYLMIMICFTCCRSCENCDDMMRCNYNTKNHNNQIYHQTNNNERMRTQKKIKHEATNVEMVHEDVQV